MLHFTLEIRYYLPNIPHAVAVVEYSSEQELELNAYWNAVF
jgi:hypothetical protein